MALEALKCPNCDANIQVNGEKDFCFCTYCGVQIKLNVPDTPYEAEFQRRLEDARSYLKMADYYKAERKCEEIVREYPSEPKGYEYAIRAITSNHVNMSAENKDKVLGYANRLCAVAVGDEKEYYEEYRKFLRSSYENNPNAFIYMAEMEKVEKLKREQSKCKSRAVSAVVIVLILLLINIPPFLPLFAGVIILLIQGKIYTDLKSEISMAQAKADSMVYQVKQDNSRGEKWKEF